jgi:hypothetical protein
VRLLSFFPLFSFFLLLKWDLTLYFYPFPFLCYSRYSFDSNTRMHTGILHHPVPACPCAPTCAPPWSFHRFARRPTSPLVVNACTSLEFMNASKLWMIQTGAARWTPTHAHARQFLLPYTMPCRACPCTPTSMPSNVGLRVCFCVSFACFVWSWSFHPTDFSTASETLLPLDPDEPDSDT